jgi:RNA polymerase sigma-70 factor (ECF subfamily)
MADPVIVVERGASQVRRGLRWATPRPEPRTGVLPGFPEAEDRSYASPESLFMDQYESLARAMTLIAHDPDVARDAVQEAFVRLCREWPTVSGYRHQAAWVRKVAFNLVRDQQRQLGRRAHLVLRLGGGPIDLAPDDPPAEGNPELWRAVRQLPERQRTAVGLFYIADLNIAEVGAAMGVSEGTVKRHLDRARNTLRTKIKA